MAKKIATALFIVISIIGNAASASSDAKNPTTTFSDSAQESMLVCKLQYRAYAFLVSMGGGEDKADPSDECISSSKISIRPEFKAALSQQAKNKSAQSLLKDYYAAWLSAMDGIKPSSGEREIMYSNRQAETERRLAELWNRFEIEAGI